jgi:hypothetical protein
VPPRFGRKGAQWTLGGLQCPAAHSDHRGGYYPTAVEGLAQAGIGSVYGTSRSLPFDRWFRYPAGFSAATLARALEAVDGESTRRIVDPLCGAATVACALPSDRTFAGIEAHPLIAELAALKVARVPGPPSGLRRAAVRLSEEASPGDPEGEHPLVQRCFESDTLASLVSLRDALPPRSPWRHHLRWALLGTLRDVASVRVGWPYQRPGVERVAPFDDAVVRFVARAELMADDLEAHGPPPLARIVRGDARTPGAWRRASQGERFHACVTSPPYLNNFDYADATRLELYFLGRVRSWSEMCRRVRSGMMIATTQQSRTALMRRGLAALARHAPATEREVRALVARLGEERAGRRRGKEYDRVLPAYFADLARVFTQLHSHFVPGGRCAIVIGDSAPYGVYIDTPRMVGRLAGELGFELVGDQPVRSRGRRWRTNGNRHQVDLAERLITLVRA